MGFDGFVKDGNLLIYPEDQHPMGRPLAKGLKIEALVLKISHTFGPTKMISL